MFWAANFSSKNVLINYVFEKHFKETIRQFVSGKLIDIGCGTKPYAHLLAPYITEHVGVDHEATLHDQSNIDLYGTAYQIPTPSDAFDAAICTAVLEHLEEPEAALTECLRVLRPGGTAVYSVPFIWHLHEEPRDFFRYSKYGLKYLFTKVGFEIVAIKPLSGFWVTFGQLLVYNLYRFNRGPLRFVPVIPLLGLAIQALSFALDKIDTSEQWTWMYIVVARKPQHSVVDRTPENPQPAPQRQPN